MSHHQPPPHGTQSAAPGYGPPLYGTVPPPPPPAARRTTKTLLVAAVVVAISVAGAAGFLLGEDHTGPAATSAGASLPPRPYKLTVPPSLLDGVFVIDPDIIIRITDKDMTSYAEAGIRNAKGVSAHYKSGSSASRQQVQFSGAWGTIDDPDRAVDHEIARLTDSRGPGDKRTAVGVPQNVAPGGLEDAVMKCQMLKVSDPTAPSDPATTYPVCVWADHSTLGQVTVIDPNSFASGGTGVTLDEDADTAAKVRQAVRTPVS